MHRVLMVADSEVAEEEGGEEVLGVEEEVEAFVETWVVLVVEGEGVEDLEVEEVGIEEEEVVELVEVRQGWSWWWKGRGWRMRRWGQRWIWWRKRWRLWRSWWG